jgi:hypothetical protein
VKNNTFTFLFALLFGCQLFAQDETMRILQSDRARFLNDTLFVQGSKARLMIIPFEPIMFRTQIGQEIGAASGVNYDQLSTNFRRGLDNVLFIETDRKFSVVRMIVEEPEIKKDLYAIYGASRHEYRALPKPTAKKKRMRLGKNPPDAGTPSPPHTSGRIEKGQVISEPFKGNRFMARSIRDKGLFDHLYDKYETILYLFINQLEIRPMEALDYRAYEGGEYQREILVHYSIYSDGFEIFSGVAVRGFSSSVNDQKQIILENFPALAAEIVAKLPVVHLAGSK